MVGYLDWFAYVLLDILIGWRMHVLIFGLVSVCMVVYVDWLAYAWLDMERHMD